MIKCNPVGPILYVKRLKYDFEKYSVQLKVHYFVLIKECYIFQIHEENDRHLGAETSENDVTRKLVCM